MKCARNQQRTQRKKKKNFKTQHNSISELFEYMQRSISSDQMLCRITVHYKQLLPAIQT